MLNDTLWSMLDSGMFDTTGSVNKALVGSIASVLEDQYDEGEALIGNLSPKTADSNGIAMWEKVLGLPTDPTLPLSQRQNLASAKAYRLIGALSYSQLNDIVNIFSASKTAQVIESPSTYQVYGRILASEVANMPSLLKMVKNVLPAHLQFIPSFIAIVVEQVQAQRTSQLSWTRDTWMNNGGILSNGKFLDETAGKLDGTWLLNDTGHPDFDVLKAMNIAVSRVVTYLTNAQRSSTVVATRVTPEQFITGRQGTIALTRNTWANNGGIQSTGKFMDETALKMDGSWNLDDAGHPNFDVIRNMQISIIRILTATPSAIKNVLISLTRQATEQFTTVQNQTTSVIRVTAALSQSTLLTGTWSLDGSVNLSRSAYPMTVTINGTQV